MREEKEKTRRKNEEMITKLWDILHRPLFPINTALSEANDAQMLNLGWCKTQPTTAKQQLNLLDKRERIIMMQICVIGVGPVYIEREARGKRGSISNGRVEEE